MPEIVYKCSYCGNEYSSYMDARWCEILHTRCPQEEKDRIFREELLAAKQNPCLFCARGYFVYGTEFCCEDADCRDYKGFLMKIKT